MDAPLEAFDLTVDRDDDLPLATQLAWKLKALIAAGHGRGTFVAEGPGGAELGRLAASAAADAASAGLDRRELAAALYGASGLALTDPGASSPPQPAREEERRLRRQLRREISQLEGDLATLEPLSG